ncbi:hypothetical protein R8Z50_10740 [Longispora sp. K20-0274]|uniref:YaaC family protein n=1 Tax=Longispora sp. K20-0274 TaxID=3088255 RepID=UPI0039994ECF
MNPQLVRMGLRYRIHKLKDTEQAKKSAARRDTIAAALHQFEELLDASARVGASSRPITLYYALVQAGLAISAVHNDNPWSFGKHGLKLNPDFSGADLTALTVRPDGQGAFQAGARATGSPAIAGAVSLDALWASLPDLGEIPLQGSTVPRALDAFESRGELSFQIDFDGSPRLRESEKEDGLRLTLVVDGKCPAPGRAREHLRQLLAGYPLPDGFSVLEDTFRVIREGRWSAAVAWRQDLELNAVAPEYRFVDRRHIRPSVESDQAQPPSPLMTWWLLLYAFSMLSRYFSRDWSRMLNIQRSEIAAKLEHALDLALEVLPHLIIEALDGKPTLTTKAIEL